MTATRAHTPPAPAAAAMFQGLAGAWIAQAAHAVATLDVSDALADALAGVGARPAGQGRDGDPAHLPRRPARPRVLLLEEVVPPGDEPGPVTFTDLLMLVYPGGKERTAEEYGRLLAAAGLRMTAVVPTPSSISVIEAVPG